MTTVNGLIGTLESMTVMPSKKERKKKKKKKREKKKRGGGGIFIAKSWHYYNIQSNVRTVYVILRGETLREYYRSLSPRITASGCQPCESIGMTIA